MRAVVQRVRQASVSVDGQRIAQIGPGAVVLLGVDRTDQSEQALWLAQKIAKLRFFEGKGANSESTGPVSMLHYNSALRDNSALREQRAGNAAPLELLVVSQFTLLASCRKGNKPSFTQSAASEQAAALYELFCQQLADLLDQAIATGRFGADMQVQLVNDGPYTLVIDSPASNSRKKPASPTER